MWCVVSIDQLVKKGPGRYFQLDIIRKFFNQYFVQLYNEQSLDLLRNCYGSNYVWGIFQKSHIYLEFFKKIKSMFTVLQDYNFIYSWMSILSSLDYHLFSSKLPIGLCISVLRALCFELYTIQWSKRRFKLNRGFNLSTEIWMNI